MLPRRLTLLVALATLGLSAGCGGSSSPTGKPDSAGPVSSPSTSGPVVLVTNDDGVSAPGIDSLVTQLRTLPGIAVHVVAPAQNQSGSGGRTTPGRLQHRPTTTASGYPAESVDGYPADTVRVALDDLGLKPVLVVSGANKGQNLGTITDISGTVGAARAAAQRGIPAIAVSAGLPGDSGQYDFAVAATFAKNEAQKELTALRLTPGSANSSAGTSTGASPSTGTGTGIDTTTVANLNVPSCDPGQVRGLEDLPPETTPDPRSLDSSDCTSNAPPSNEVGSFVDGFAVLTRIPSRV